MGVTDGGRGLHVALLGIDGSGKTTLVGDLAERAQRRGIPVHKVSWRGFVERPEADGYPLEEMRRLWARSFRLYFTGATDPEGRPVDPPTSFDELNRRGGTEYLNGIPMSEQAAHGPLAAAWIELAANTLLHREVIQPLVARGHLVLQESYGYKHLLKLFAYADKLAGAPDALTAGCREFVTNYFGGYLVPDVGVFVAADPAVALRWRMRQAGRLGTFETFASAGDDPQQSFLDLQSEATARYADFAECFGWTRVESRDTSREENLRTTLEVLSSTPLAGLLDLEPREAA